MSHRIESEILNSEPKSEMSFFVAEMAVATASGSRARRLERAGVQGLRQDLQVAEKPLGSFGNLASGEQIILHRGSRLM